MALFLLLEDEALDYAFLLISLVHKGKQAILVLVNSFLLNKL